MYLILDNDKRIEIPKELVTPMTSFLATFMEAEKKNTGFCVAESKESWHIDSHGRVLPSNNNADIREFLNGFTSETFAKKIRDRQLLERKLIKFSLEHDADKIDPYNVSQCKFFIFYSYDTEKLQVSPYASTIGLGEIAFSSEAIAKQAIETFHAELLKYFTEWRIV